MHIKGYLHEVWLCLNTEGEYLPACIPLGPSGNDARNLNEPGSKCVWVFWANSHFEAMTIFNEFSGYGEYSTDQKWDYESYPEEWVHEQLGYLLDLTT